ncbi:Gfo/Idh/MocA family oxidoreductase [Amycolatopsis sp. NPDC026612]|uniref:Gfo/Idh/MocA family protein n=1 Tax=Amycolatopsis sp. NPDC026612 TaxID=3155466 RepID=UPI0033CB91ED
MRTPVPTAHDQPRRRATRNGDPLRGRLANRERHGAVIRSAVLGAGMAGRRHAEFYHSRPDVELTAIVEPCRDERIAGLPGSVPLFDSLDNLWEADLNVDVISVCSPPAAHCANVLQAVERGVGCLCEKPLTRTSAEAWQLTAAATRGAAPVIPVHNYAHSPWWRSLKAAVYAAVPETLTVSIERPHAAFGVAGRHAGWRTDAPVSGGGIVWDFGVHALYLADDLFAAAPLSARTSCWREERGCEIECDITFTYPGDRLLRFTGSWCSRRRTSSWCVTAQTQSGGAITLTRQSPSGTGLWLDGVFAEYLMAREGSRAWRRTLRSSAAAILAAEAARRSARSLGTTVLLDAAALHPV